MLSGERGLRRIRVDADAVIRVCLGQITTRGRPLVMGRTAAAAVVGDGELSLSVLDVARELGVKHEVIYGWTRRGLLRTVRGGGGLEKGRRITRAALDDFRRTYMTGRDVRLAMGDMADRWNTRMLARIGIDPVSGPDTDRVKMALFRRDQITPEVLGRLRRFRTGTRLTDSGELRRQTSSRLSAALDVIAATWGTGFTRSRNTCREVGGQRVVYLVPGRRQTFSGPMYFYVTASAVAALRSEPSAFVALVPRDSQVMLLVPAGSVPWLVSDDKAHLIVPYDRDGNPQRFAEHAIRMDTADREAA